MRVELECTYCGHKWEKTAYNKESIESEVCPHCKDSTLKVRDLSTSKVDYYKGSPPFPTRGNDWTFMGSGYPFAETEKAIEAIRSQILRSLAMRPGDFLDVPRL
jgi:NAD-dependent SIR2 family protein deacetylase